MRQRNAYWISKQTTRYKSPWNTTARRRCCQLAANESSVYLHLAVGYTGGLPERIRITHQTVSVCPPPPQWRIQGGNPPPLRGFLLLSAHSANTIDATFHTKYKKNDRQHFSLVRQIHSDKTIQLLASRPLFLCDALLNQIKSPYRHLQTTTLTTRQAPSSDKHIY